MYFGIRNTTEKQQFGISGWKMANATTGWTIIGISLRRRGENIFKENKIILRRLFTIFFTVHLTFDRSSNVPIPNNSPHKFCAKVFVKIENDR